ncbi:hypothetical protein Pcinc_007006 [Petrolisthes cinctipes]|uniref:Hexosyltransferase n=1 Tax=Petrolisthes cinctipes TaxID=88211 RepID=A0AAE1KXD7_PETCI|nr:hypothetical protein Pcinc_007006 [Petrolisthes cinctipes]
MISDGSHHEGWGGSERKRNGSTQPFHPSSTYHTNISPRRVLAAVFSPALTNNNEINNSKENINRNMISHQNNNDSNKKYKTDIGTTNNNKNSNKKPTNINITHPNKINPNSNMNNNHINNNNNNLDTAEAISEYDYYYDYYDDEGDDSWQKQDDYQKYGESFARHALFSDLHKPGFLVENGHLCRSSSDKKPIRVFVFINSRVHSSGSRQAIRSSYVSDLKLQGVPHAFLLSKPENQSTLTSVLQENALHGDLIVTTTPESYRNLTLKTAHMLEWTARHCNSHYVAKVDDDVYLNVTAFLRTLTPYRTHTILGKVCRNCLPYRGVGQTLRESLMMSPGGIVVTRRHLPLTTLPPFVMGPGYVMTVDLAAPLLKVAEEMVYLGQEDVFWTGMAVDELNQDPYSALYSSLDPVSIKQKWNQLGGGGNNGGSGGDKDSGGVGSGNNGDGDNSRGGSGGGRGRGRVWVNRVDIPGWRADVRGKSNNIPITNAVVVHGVDWKLYRQQLGLP